MAAAGGKSTPIDIGIVARLSGQFSAFKDKWFGASAPPEEIAPQIEPRGYDYPFAANLYSRPRQNETISFDDLRNLATNCGVLAAVIQTRIDQMKKMQWKVRLKKVEGQKIKEYKTANANDKRITEITHFLSRPDKEHDWATWLGGLLYDLLVIDAPTIYPRKTLDGKLYSLNLIDGATIKRVIDDNAMTPLPPNPAYQQILKGVPARSLTTEELIYRPTNLRTNKIYGFSPVEQIILIVNIALRKDIYSAEYFTEGNMPDTLLRVPETWTPKQIEDFTAGWDTLITDTADRRKVRFVPNFEPIIAKPDMMTKDEQQDYLSRVICFCFSISPQALVKMMNRGTGETSKEQAQEEGLMPMMGWVKSLINDIIVERFKYDDLEFAWEDDKEEDSLKQAEIDDLYVRAGIKSIDETRERLGLDAIGCGNAIITPTGLLPIDIALKQAEVGLDAAKAGAQTAQHMADNPVDPNAPPKGEKVIKSKKKLY